MLEAAQAISEEEGALLSRIYLTHTLSEIDEEHKASFIERKLVVLDDGMARLSKEAMAAVSAHPLLGTGCEHEIYPECFHQMLIASESEKEMEECAASCFPNLDKAETRRLLEPILSAFSSLGIPEDMERTGLFLSLPFESRLAYILCPLESDKRKAAAKAVALSERIAGLDAAREEEIENLIRRTTDYDDYSFFMLENMQLLYRKNGKLYGRKCQDGEHSLIVSSDFSIIVQGRTSAPLHLFAEPRKGGVVSEWMITRDSVRKSLLSGYGSEKIMMALESEASEAIPESVKSRIRFWEETLSSVKASEAIVLTVSERAERLIRALGPQLESYVISHPADGIYIMSTETWKWRPIFSTVGLDVLGNIKERTEDGMKADVEISPIIYDISLPEERAVSFDREKRQRLLATDDAYRAALVLSGMICSESQETPELCDVVLGLDYQGKKRLISSAMNHGGKIYAEFIGGSVIIAKPEKSEKEGYVFLNGREIEIAKIWKTALLSISIASITRLKRSSDNDSL